jgi:hypothetical protein
VADPSSAPSSSRSSAREPPVPTSIPRTVMVCLLYLRTEETAETAKTAENSLDLLRGLSELCGSV